MTPTKRCHGQDQLGRSGSSLPICLLPLALFTVIVGSAWPTSARSPDPAYDSCHHHQAHLAQQLPFSRPRSHPHTMAQPLGFR